ncbi:NlpC/P60 family protein [Jiangella mangrovi]|uniref:Cell wall-associated NlpC family hydrolase n=1 Tax=Jiangella mangrovi TaxID=1524084 RepID=A0A7W9LL07_9ACTN|nr:C40 family peptidase [Jiangella mangrovi]MBB5787661.1 cell wall-associated NlpC family hydrolase [Jiangella mangrovi]
MWAGAFATALAAGVVGPAFADPTFPTESEIQDARDAERAAAGGVAALEARLATLSAQVDALYIQAAKAIEAYNGARLQLEQATEAESTAREAARQRAAEAEQARVDLGRMAAATYSQGGQLAGVGMVLGAEDGQALYDGLGALRAVTRSQTTIAQRARDAQHEADDAAAVAADALAERSAAAEQADAARAAAEAAVAGQEQAVAAVEEQRSAAIAQLAVARGTTVDLERQRQEGLAAEQAAQEQAEEEQQPEPPVAPPVTTPPTLGPPDDPTVPTEPTAPPEPTTPPQPTAPPQPTTEPEPPPEPEPEPSPTQTRPPEPEEPEQPDPPGDGAQAAVNYAFAQLGKPYQWGADGPNSFDCSGLTMRAWQAGGVDLPHWSVAQAQRVDRVSYANLRPGDLIFWSDNGQASGVYHVGLYIGGGQMIHAPRPGKDVEVQSVFYWIDPSFYGRV